MAHGDDERDTLHAKWEAAYEASGCNGNRDKLAHWLIDQKEHLERENAKLCRLLTEAVTEMDANPDIGGPQPTDEMRRAIA